MAKKDYEDIDDLLSELTKDIEESMRGNVNKKVKEIYKNKAEQSYGDYSPKYPDASRYRRGESGSFADDVNFKEELVVDGDTFTYTLENHTETDCDCAYCRSKKLRIDTFVEEGIAGKSSIKAKLVYELAQEQVDSEIESLLMDDLSKKGW